MSRLSGYCPELTELLKNRASTTVVPLDELADLLFKVIPTLNLDHFAENAPEPLAPSGDA